jgi:hypothetical protein
MNIQTNDPHNFFNILLDALIKQRRLIMSVSKWNERLKRLEKAGSITCEERKILLELAEQLQPEELSMSLGVMTSPP